MSVPLSCIATQLSVCATSAACNLCCRQCGLASSTATRFAYVGVFVFFTILAWIMTTQWAANQLAKIPHIAQDFLHAHCITEGGCKLTDLLGAMVCVWCVRMHVCVWCVRAHVCVWCVRVCVCLPVCVVCALLTLHARLWATRRTSLVGAG